MGGDVHLNARQSDGEPKPEEPTMRRLKRRFMLTTAVLGLMAGAAAPARADISLVFNAAGIFEDGAPLSGTLTIDTTSGMVTAANLTVGAPISCPLLLYSSKIRIVRSGSTQSARYRNLAYQAYPV